MADGAGGGQQVLVMLGKLDMRNLALVDLLLHDDVERIPVEKLQDSRRLT